MFFFFFKKKRTEENSTIPKPLSTYKGDVNRELQKPSILCGLTDGRPLSRLDRAKASFALCSLLHRF